MPNKTASGNSFTQADIDRVWAKGIIEAPHDKDVYRKDKCGNWMEKNEYGNRDHKWGWEIDHIKPVAKGGTDDISNLQPLNWKNNASKGDQYPWNC